MSANRKRKKEILVYLSDDEAALLEAKTKAMHFRSKSDYLRYMLTHGEICHLDFAELKPYNEKLEVLAKRMNAIAKEANTNGYATEKQVAEARAIIEEVYAVRLAAKDVLP